MADAVGHAAAVGRGAGDGGRRRAGRPSSVYWIEEPLHRGDYAGHGRAAAPGRRARSPVAS